MPPYTLQRVHNIGTLRRGEQVAWKCTERGVITYYHHGIVENVDEDAGTINCIERTPCGVGREVHDADKEVTFLVLHPNRRYSNSDTYKRAKSRLDEEGYELRDNNCEHFANWCSTGEDRSYQAEDRWLGCTLCVVAKKKKAKKF